jgi:hypothetical protein
VEDDQPLVGGQLGGSVAGRIARKAAARPARKFLVAVGVKGGFWVGLVVLLLLVIAAAAGAAGRSAAAASPTCSGVAGTQAAVTGSPSGLTVEQASNARAIASVAVALGLGKRGVLVGIDVAITESTLNNIDYGDVQNGAMTSSRGLFQQLSAWVAPGAVPDPRLDPVTAATMVYTGGAAGQQGLTSIPGWQDMPVPQAAQAVQRSEFADGSNYAANLAQAQGITTALLGGQTLPAAALRGNVCTRPAGVASPVYTPTGLTHSDSQDPTSFGWVHRGPLEPLVWQGHDFGRVAAGTTKLWTAMLDELVPLIPGGLTADLGCYEDRANVNNPSVLSFHAYGLACDVNSGDTPNGAPGYGRTGRYVIPLAAHDIAARYCMQWGGDFRGVQDPMHFEIHCTPTQIAAWAATQP